MWNIDYSNDVGENDDCFVEWWTVSNGTKTFKCDTADDAAWLWALLNKHGSE